MCLLFQAISEFIIKVNQFDNSRLKMELVVKPFVNPEVSEKVAHDK